MTRPVVHWRAVLVRPEGLVGDGEPRANGPPGRGPQTPWDARGLSLHNASSVNRRSDATLQVAGLRPALGV